MAKKKTIVVTGASSGIGAACALRLDRRGFNVLAGVRRDEDGESLKRHASERLDYTILDVCDPQQIENTLNHASEWSGGPGVVGLVNNAGIAVAGPLEYVPIADLRHQFEVNVVGLMAVTQAFIPMLRENSGRIVNMGSMAGRLAVPFVGPYGASKHALVALTDALRFELRPCGICVSLVEPGAVKTGIWEKSIDAAEKILANLPEDDRLRYRHELDGVSRGAARAADNAISPEKVADAVEHALLSPHPKARYLVGMDSRVQSLASKVLPLRVRDAVVRIGLRHLSGPST